VKASTTAADTIFPLRQRKKSEDRIPYSKQALEQDLLRVRNAWDDCQASRERNAIYGYLSAVFDLVTWWAAEGRAISRARWALRLCHLDLPNDEPFAAVILCTSDREKVDKRTRSKWSRVLRYAAEYKPLAEPLASFVQRKGGINKCAERFARCLGRRKAAQVRRPRPDWRNSCGIIGSIGCSIQQTSQYWEGSDGHDPRRFGSPCTHGCCCDRCSRNER
jgi:hypothetical protein